MATFYAVTPTVDLHRIFFHNLLLVVLQSNIVAKKRVVPDEINDHLKLFGKEPWEVDYGEKCPLCKSRIDEYGFCSCGSSGE